MCRIDSRISALSNAQRAARSQSLRRKDSVVRMAYDGLRVLTVTFISTINYQLTIIIIIIYFIHLLHVTCKLSMIVIIVRPLTTIWPTMAMYCTQPKISNIYNMTKIAKILQYTNKFD